MLPGPSDERAIEVRPRPGRWRFALGVAGLMVAALALRLWGVGHGLPFVYNLDEGAHFVPKAIAFFATTYNPHYFINPPALSYLLHIVFAIWFGGRDGASHAYAVDQTAVFEVARATTAVLGTLAVGLTVAFGVRLLDRRVGIVAGAVVAVAFLPVYYSHLALNDVPALAPLALSLYGSAGILVRDCRRDWVLAGAGLGLGIATKYTAGIALLPLVTAAALRLARAPGRRRNVVLLVAVAGAAAFAAFAVANPFSITSFSEFHAGVTQQQTAATEVGKLGQTQASGVLYYLWTLTWGIGWAPAVAAAAGALLLARNDWRRALVVVPYPLLFLMFMGSQGRYFGRWLMPVLPAVAVLAAYAFVWAADRVRTRSRLLGRVILAAGTAALLVQSLVHSVHADLVLSRTDTRALARVWLVANVPAGGKVVIEPVVPQPFIQDPGRPLTVTPSGDRWIKYSTGKSTIENNGRRTPNGRVRIVNVEDYERIVRPELLRDYKAKGYCTVMIGSTQYGRALNQPGAVPRAIDYYGELARQGEAVFRASPYRPGHAPVRFNFDWSFDYYPLAYRRPGPQVTIYRLRGGQCA